LVPEYFCTGSIPVVALIKIKGVNYEKDETYLAFFWPIKVPTIYHNPESCAGSNRYYLGAH
jgi:hypothetical protein